MAGMMKYSATRLHETAWAKYASIKGIHARKRFQMSPRCRSDSLYATRAATSPMQTAQAMFRRIKTEIL
jgi:hypothetical protein